MSQTSNTPLNIHTCDTKIGPCSCGAWHRDPTAIEPYGIEAARAVWEEAKGLLTQGDQPLEVKNLQDIRYVVENWMFQRYGVYFDAKTIRVVLGSLDAARSLKE